MKYYYIAIKPSTNHHLQESSLFSRGVWGKLGRDGLCIHVTLKRKKNMGLSEGKGRERGEGGRGGERERGRGEREWRERGGEGEREGRGG